MGSVRRPGDLVDVPRDAADLPVDLPQFRDRSSVGFDEPAHPTHGDPKGAVPLEPEPRDLLIELRHLGLRGPHGEDLVRALGPLLGLGIHPDTALHAALLPGRTVVGLVAQDGSPEGVMGA